MGGYEMAWIEVIPEAEATGRLKELYEKYTEPWGGVDHIISIHSLNVKSMQVHYDLYAHLMRGRSALTRSQREMIAVVASAVNECHY
jgi:alkylhydroperoxidase family enzyme